MVESTRKLITDENELNRVFNATPESLKKGIGRKPKFELPGANESKIVRLCYTKIGESVGFIYQTYNEAFQGANKTANFITIETLDKPGFEMEMNCPSSLYNSFHRISDEEGISINDMPGKIVEIMGVEWKSAPINKRDRKRKCPCGGKGCNKCIITGSGKDAGKASGLLHPVVFNAQLRKDLMESVDTADISGEDEF